MHLQMWTSKELGKFRQTGENVLDTQKKVQDQDACPRLGFPNFRSPQNHLKGLFKHRLLLPYFGLSAD